MDMATPWQPAMGKTYRFRGQEYRLRYLDLTTIPLIEGPFDMEQSLQAIPSLTSVEDIFAHVIHCARSLGFESVTYGMLFYSVKGTPVLTVSTPMSLRAWESAHAMGLMELDETLFHADQRRIPGVWRLKDSQLHHLGPILTGAYARFCNSRVVVPLHGPTSSRGLMGFNSTDPAIDERLGDKLTEVLMMTQFLSMHAHEQICSVGLWDELTMEGTADYFPTEREQDVLILLSKGNTVPEVAGLLGVKDVTVNYYIQKLKGKLHAATLAELVSKASDLGIIRARVLARAESGAIVNLSPYWRKELAQ